MQFWNRFIESCIVIVDSFKCYISYIHGCSLREDSEISGIEEIGISKTEHSKHASFTFSASFVDPFEWAKFEYKLGTI